MLKFYTTLYFFLFGFRDLTMCKFTADPRNPTNYKAISEMICDQNLVFLFNIRILNPTYSSFNPHKWVFLQYLGSFAPLTET